MNAGGIVTFMILSGALQARCAAMNGPPHEPLVNPWLADRQVPGGLGSVFPQTDRLPRKFTEKLEAPFLFRVSSRLNFEASSSRHGGRPSESQWRSCRTGSIRARFAAR